MGLIAYWVVQGVCWAAPSMGYLLGFSALGPVGGSIAAAAQTYMGASVMSGSYFAMCQTAAMIGAAAPTP